MAETSTKIQRKEEKSAALHPVKFETLVERVNNMFETIAKRAYEIFEGKGRIVGYDLDDWFRAEAELLHPVHVQVTESGKTLEVKAEVPGFNEKEIEVSVEPGRLTIAGRRESSKEQKEGKTLYAESCLDQILRVVDLPIEVDADKVTVTLKNGILRLTMPKAAKGKGIDIKPKAA
jgi:HSP20 family protein